MLARRGISRPLGQTLRATLQTLRRHSTDTEYNEPGGSLAHDDARQSAAERAKTRVFGWGYLGSVALFAFLWQYRADDAPEEWARREAARRMRERGLDLALFEYRPPDVYG